MPYSTKRFHFHIWATQTCTQYWPKSLQMPVSPTVTIESPEASAFQSQSRFQSPKRTNVRPAMIHYCAQILYQFCCATRSSVTAFLTCIFGLDSKNAPLWLKFLINCGTVRIRPGNVSYIQIQTHHPGRQFPISHLFFNFSLKSQGIC